MTDDPIDDRTAIREVLLRYARGVDARNLALVASCFTPDAAYRGTLAEGTIVDALAALSTAMQRYAATRHAIGGQSVEIDGDTATSSADCTAKHWFPGGDCRTVRVLYRDDLVRGRGGWQIARREVETLWTSGRDHDDA